MRKEASVYSLMSVVSMCLILTGLNISGLSQVGDNERSRLKDFGASLKKFDKQDKPKNGNQKPANIAEISRRDAEDEIVRIDTTLFINDVLVLDQAGQPVKGLNKNDFIVREDDDPQEIEIFVSGDSELIPRSIVLLIDYSGSQLPYINTSVEAAKVLIDKLNPRDRMAIVTDDIELLQNFTNDKTLLKERLEDLKRSALSGKTGRSRQYSALMAVLNELFVDEDLRPIIIFQTDGDELSLLKGKAGSYLRPNKDEITFSYEDVVSAAEKARATIYTIIPGQRFIGIEENERVKKAKIALENSEKALAEIRNSHFKPGQSKLSAKLLRFHAESYSRQQAAIAEVAKITGGWTDYLEQPEEADKVYSAILAGMNQRYLIGYYPTNQTRDGRVRRVKTEVRGRVEYTIRGRKTYVPPREQ